MPKLKMFQTQTTNSITISDACQLLACNEQQLRLTLANINPAFDTLKTLSDEDLSYLQANLNPPALAATQPPIQPQSQPTPDNAESAESLTRREFEPSPQKQQNPTLQGSDLLAEVDRIIQEEVSLADAIGSVRNRVVLHNLDCKDSELAEELNLRHQARKQAYLESIRGIAARKQDLTPLTPDTINLDRELSNIYQGMGGK